MKNVQKGLKEYLKNPEIDNASRAIYSAIYNALAYYQSVSELSISGETENKTFLENTINQINEDYQYLAEKYNKNGYEVVKVKARVKSPVSALDKILEKVEEYVTEGRDLRKLNESLRDFIGVRFIIDAPPEIKAQGKQAESDFCYQVFNDLMTHHGIIRQVENQYRQENDFNFIPVNTEHDPNKLQKIKDRAKKGFLFNPKEENLFVPKTRPRILEIYDEFFKDYRMFPKPKLYQRIHICAHPFYSKLVPKTILPKHIIPPKSNEPAIEYQFCTAEEEYWAEYGKAAHTNYKDRNFHRSGVPLLIELDKTINKVRLHRFDECMKKFYGYEFKNMFNIDYQDFLRIFDTQQRDRILAGNLQVVYDEQNHEYNLKEVPRAFILYNKNDTNFVKNLLEKTPKSKLKKFFEKNNLLDNTIDIKNKKILSPKIKVYKFEKMSKKHSISKLNTNEEVKKSEKNTIDESPNFEEGPEQ